MRAFLAVFVLTSTLVVSTSLASQAEECPKRIEGTNDFDFSCMTEGEDPTVPAPGGTGGQFAYKSCLRLDGSTYDDWYWATPGDGPSLSELALRAFGALNFPEFTPTFNPPTRTFVNLETWCWAEGATTGELVSSSALCARRMRLVWDIRFERNGAPIDPTGVPAVFVSPWQDTAVPVREVQTVVTPRGR